MRKRGDGGILIIKIAEKKTISSTPALRNVDGKWILDSGAKANVLATTLASEFFLAPEACNEYNEVGVSPYRGRMELDLSQNNVQSTY